MAIPTAPNYPDTFDSDENLYLVHDKLRMTLSEDYNFGDTSIIVEGDAKIMASFPPTGIITLTEQCSTPKERAISLHYSGLQSDPSLPFQFIGLEVMPGFDQVASVKPARLTNVTLNVYADHHNNLKDTLISIQEFVGVKGTTDIEPFGETMEGRINFLRSFVLVPKAWFTVDNTINIVPFDVEFTDLSFRLGDDDETLGHLELTWDFGDGNILIQTDPGQTLTHTYTNPGLFTVKLTVKNDFGEDSVEFKDLINARIEAPNKATVNFIEQVASQEVTPGVPSSIPGEPFAVPPKIRSPINVLVEFDIPQGVNPNEIDRSFAGELLDINDDPIDPILTYTWSLGDDLTHGSGPSTKASYSVGGIYDMRVRTDTSFNSYRITTYENSIDIVEDTNLWVWQFVNSTEVRSYEFGLISESFKVSAVPTLDVAAFRDDSFLDGVNNEEQQKREFNRNVGFAPRSSIQSGRQGTSLLYWAGGRAPGDPGSVELINFRDFNGFTGTYLTPSSDIFRPWNWTSLNTVNAVFFLFGTTGNSPLPFQSPTNSTLLSVNKNNLAETNTSFGPNDFISGAEELLQNVTGPFDGSGDAPYGHFSVYRSAVKDNIGYIVRNDGVGPTFRIKSFYRTEGTIGAPIQRIRKLQDIQGTTKLECQMTNLTNGVYVLNNSGSVSIFVTSTGTWATGGPGENSVAFRSLQDTSVPDFDNTANTLLVASDSDRRAYIAYDYSPNAFLKFNEADSTFVTLVPRPEGELWNMGVF